MANNAATTANPVLLAKLMRGYDHAVRMEENAEALVDAWYHAYPVDTQRTRG